MQLDLKKHKLLRIIIGQTLKFDSDELPENEPMGVPFESILGELNCDMIQLNLIAAELYMENEISYHDNLGVKGLSCIHYGKIAYSNNKYRHRYWSDILDFNLKMSQILIPLLSLLVAIIAIVYSRQDKINTKDIEILQSEIRQIKLEQAFQTKASSNLEYILKTDSLTKKLK